MDGVKVIAICPIQGDGEHKLVALLSDGRMFERSRDPRAINYGPGQHAGHVWKPIAGPLG